MEFPKETGIILITRGKVISQAFYKGAVRLNHYRLGHGGQRTRLHGGVLREGIIYFLIPALKVQHRHEMVNRIKEAPEKK
jgi:hypothetical protein